MYLITEHYHEAVVTHWTYNNADNRLVSWVLCVQEEQIDLWVRNVEGQEAVEHKVGRNKKKKHQEKSICQQ